MESKGWVYAFAWKTDGSAWILRHANSGWPEFLRSTEEQTQFGIRFGRLPHLDNIRWRGLIDSDYLAFAGVRDDGTLWYWNYYGRRQRRWNAPPAEAVPTNEWSPVQIGKDSDWAELSGLWERLAARKTDGSLWGWETPRSRFVEPLLALREPPARLGTDNDWIALGVVEGDITSLAADGNLWGWPNPEPVGIFGDKWDLYLAASRKPARIENILGAGN